MTERVKISYFDTGRTKIKEIYRDEELYCEMEENSRTEQSLPDASAYYTTPLHFPKPGEERPYIVSSIVLSLDGKMAYMDNKTGPLIAKCNFLDKEGAGADFWCLNMLRAYSDALLIGANTLRNEPDYINYCMDENLFRQRKEVLHKPEQPLQVLVSLDGTDVPFDHQSFRVDTNEHMKLVLATSPAGWNYIRENSTLKHTVVGPFCSKEEVDRAAFPDRFADYDEFPVIITGKDNQPDMELMLYALRKWGIELICAESPTYCGALIEKGCLDEYFINYSMVYVGGTMSPGAIFPQSWLNHPHADLVSIGLHRRNFIFTRQRIRYGVKED